MNFTFDLTKQDYLDFNIFTVQNYKFYNNQKKYLRILFMIIPFAVGVVNYLFESKSKLDFSDIIMFSLMAILSILFWKYFPKLFDKLTQKNAERVLFREGKLNNILGKRSLFFDEDNIRCITQYEESLTKYEIIIKKEESKTAIYLYTTPAMAIIIPLRVFADETKKQEFINFIDKKTKKKL